MDGEGAARAPLNAKCSEAAARGCGVALADAIVALADDPERRAALGRAGRAFVTQRFNRDVLAAKMLDVLREAASMAR